MTQAIALPRDRGRIVREPISFRRTRSRPDLEPDGTFFNVPQTTLEHYVKNRQKSSSVTVKIKLGKMQVLPCEAENDLAEHCLLIKRMFFDFIMADVMCLDYQLVRNGIKTHLCKGNENAGRKWLENFRSRHPQISVRNPEALSLSRARGFTSETVAQFFKSMNKQLTPLNIILQDFTVAVTPASLLYSTNTKILGLKGRCQISAVHSAER